MSQEKVAVSSSKVVHVTSSGNTNNIDKRMNKQNSSDEFLKPQLPISKSSKSKFTSHPPTKRKSRFSDAPPSQEAPPPTVLQMLPPQSLARNMEGNGGEREKKSAILSAAAAAARINANLLAKGKIKTLPQNELTSKSTAPTASIAPDAMMPVINPEIKQVDDMFVAEVDINDIPLGCRNYLTRLTTQENVNKSCLAYVSTRGKFMLPEERKQYETGGSNDKPLYLFVQSQNKENVKKAVERIKQIINNHFEKKNKHQAEAAALAQGGGHNPALPRMGLQPTQGLNVPVPPPVYQVRPVAPLPHCQPALPSGNYMQEKVFIGLENIPEHFDLKNRLLGPNYRNFTFIANQTGAKVILRGRGSGFIEPTSGREAFEAMYAFISHPNQAGVEAAKQLVLNLINTVKQEISPFLGTMGHSNPVPAGFGPAQSNYQQPPLPVMGPASQMTNSTPVLSAYPFQQPMPVPAARTSPMAVPSPCPVNPPKRKFQEDADDGVLGYQHNFSGKASNSSNSGSSSRSSKSKSRRKRFTEETSMPPPPPPGMLAASHSRKEEKRLRKDNNHSSVKETSDDDVNATTNDQNASLKMPSLPFWMTP